MAYVPLILAAAGALQQGASAAQASRFNAQATKNEQTLSVDMGAAAEGMQRRSSREALGRQAAAFGGAGVGYEGSSETALDQSAVNQELDALNTRYKGTITGYGYGVRSTLDRQAANDEMAQGGMLAGNALLKGLSNSYSTGPKSNAAAAGLATT